MFYEPRLDDHGLPYNPFKSICVPRPIGWITTVDTEGRINLAPYSQFQNIGYDPPFVMFSASGGDQHSPRNARHTGEFVCNMATYDLREAVNITAQAVPAEESEPELAGLEMLPSRLVKPPRVARSPVHMECRYHSSVMLPTRTPGVSVEVVIGEVVGVHIRDDVLTPEGRLDVTRIRPLARMGYLDYTAVDTVFTMPPLGGARRRLSRGLEGRPLRSATLPDEAAG
ncbi:flavin reductase family protein [Roseomonas sp. KE2513]|uniref:flavin reductase family protein n=1 Tax=Roseomonas sp. KE2513 TaxID=2479202 RepID=UPI0018DFCB43|nr:flavin reductase family protein [Roseomonas sp. KE2513]MBI0538198.1 flavin reductase family protein [Roseomonas sp. KE2513]